MPRHIGLCIAMLGMLAGPAMAMAMDADPPPPDPPDFWHEVGPRHASSTCIGSKASPVCMLDTLMACFRRGGDICYRAMTEQDVAKSLAKTNPPDSLILTYRIVGAKIAEKDEEGGYYERKGGDTVIIYEIRRCYARPDQARFCPNERARLPNDELTLRREGQSWRIIDYGQPSRRPAKP